MENVVLTGRDVYAKLQDATENQKQAADKNGKPYFTFAYDGTVFTVRKEAYDAWKSGQMREITLKPDFRTIPDPADDTKTIQVNQLQYAGHMSNEQELSIATFDAKLKAISNGIGKELGLSAEQMAATI